jgi:hypothetical protein
MGGISVEGKGMLKTVEAVIDEQNNVRLLEPVQLSGARRAFVIILDEPAINIPETALLTAWTLGSEWLSFFVAQNCPLTRRNTLLTAGPLIGPSTLCSQSGPRAPNLAVERIREHPRAAHLSRWADLLKKNK